MSGEVVPIGGPNNVELERAVIGALITFPEMYDASGLRPEFFGDEGLRRVYECIGEKITKGDDPKPLSLAQVLGVEPRILSALVADGCAPKELQPYCRFLEELYLRREVKVLAADLANRAGDMKVDPAELVGEISESLMRMMPGGKSIPLGHQETLHSAIEASEERYKAGGGNVGVSTGFRQLDWASGGLCAGDLTVIAGRPGMGKTAFGLTLARNVARSGKSVLYFSLEMTADQLQQRNLASETEITYYKIRRGDVEGAAFHSFIDVERRQSDWSLFIDDTPGLSMTALAARATAIKNRYGLDLVIVDHLALMDLDHKLSMVDALGAVSTGMKRLAKRLEVHVVALCQLNRQIEGQDDKRPSMNHLRSSGRIEEDADMIGLLYRQAYYSKNEDNRLEINLAKNRNGPAPRTITLFADMATNRITDLADESDIVETARDVRFV